jgi:acetolactate synthase-1/2/3 large subunit
VLPREPLSAPLSEPIGPIKPRPVAAPAMPDVHSIVSLAEWIAAAERPLIVTAALPADAVEPLAQLAERCAIPVISYAARTLCMPSSHPMNFGCEPGTMLADADLVIVLEADVPWIPSLQQPAAGARVVHIGEEPAYVRSPMRSFPSHLAIQSGAANALNALHDALH